MKEIRNRNDNGLYHGYQERCWDDGELWVKCFYNNGTRVDYEEFYCWNSGKLRKTFYI